jgi:signal transduction histidine kinase
MAWLVRCSLFLVLVVALESVAYAQSKRVLLLHSFGRDFRPWSEYAKGIRAELDRRSPWPLDILEYSLVTARFSDDNPEVPFVEYLRALFAKHPLDLIVSVGAPAANFVQRHRAQLFPAAPMLFTAVEQRRVRFSTLTENDAVVAVSHNLPAVIENILQVLPETKTIAVVNGNSPLEKFWYGEMQKEFAQFKDRVEFIWYNTLSFADVLKASASLPPHSAIFWELMIVDAAGVTYEGDSTLAKLHAVASAPIFSFDDSFFGRELVGGPMFSVQEGSRRAAEVAVRILNGEKPSDIKTPPIRFAAPKFDWREMQRWGISESRLPAGSTIFFRDPSAWERYRFAILMVCAAILTQAALIAWLIFEHHRRTRVELRYRQSMAELTYMNRVTGAGLLSASLAHEVNQPLTGIVTRANAAMRWLKAEKPNLDRAQEALGQIVEAGHRAADVVKNVRAMFNKDTHEKSPFDVNELVQSVLGLVYFDLRRHSVETRISLGEHLPRVLGNAVQVRQVILNLMMNAIEAMSSSELRVLTLKSELTEHGGVCVSIEDSGSGIDPSSMERIFAPLYTTKTRGMGMGLSICQSIIEDHGGKIWAMPGAASGSIFQFELPASVQRDGLQPDGNQRAATASAMPTSCASRSGSSRSAAEAPS